MTGSTYVTIPITPTVWTTNVGRGNLVITKILEPYYPIPSIYFFKASPVFFKGVYCPTLRGKSNRFSKLPLPFTVIGAVLEIQPIGTDNDLCSLFLCNSFAYNNQLWPFR